MIPPFFCLLVEWQEVKRRLQVGRRKGPGRKSPSAISLVSSMSLEELKSFCQVPDGISLELSDGPAVSTVGEGDMSSTSLRSSSQLDFASPFCLW